MKVAVLIPVYNASRYLRECLDSVLAAGKVDVFCRDDGSTDDSPAILDEYAARFPNVHIARQANAGVSVTRNRLMDELPSDYDAFAFCDSDDYVAKGMYDALAEAMERTGADVAECGFDGGGELVVDDMSVYWLKRTSPGAWINVINKLYSRKAVGDVRFRHGLSFEEDLFFNREINARIRRKVLIPGEYYTYRDNPDSATHALNFKRYFESTSLRIRLSMEVFLNANRVPLGLVGEYRAELAKDAYRMVIRKNLKKNRDRNSRIELFALAGAFFQRIERELGFAPIGLNVVQRLIYLACRNGNYGTARALVCLT